MARVSKTGGKASKANARKASPAKGRKTTKTKRRIIPAAKPKRRSVANLEALLELRTNEAEQFRQQQVATGEILKMINTSNGDLAPVFDTILEKAHSVCDAPCGSLQLYHGDRVRAVAVRGLPEPFEKFLRQGFRNSALLRQRTLVHADFAELLARTPEDPALRASVELGHVRSVVFVPLVKDGLVLGRIVASRQEVRPFTGEQIALLQGFADQAVIAIENARLFNETQEALKRQAATAEILRTIASAPTDAEQSLQRIAETTAGLFGANSVTIRIAEGDEWIRTIRVGAGSKRIGSLPAAQLSANAQNLPGTVFRENRQIHIPDLDNVDPTMADWPMMTARAEGTRTISGTPLRREGKAIGALVVYRDRLAPFTNEELALQQSFADQAVIAIENARLFNETKDALLKLEVRNAELAESLIHQTATSEILSVISSSKGDIQPVFDAIVNSAAVLFEPCAATITTLRNDMIQWEAHAATLPSNDFDNASAKALYPLPFDPDRSPSSRAIHQRQIIEIPDTTATEVPESTRRVAAAGGFRSATFVPLINQDRGIGTMILTHLQQGFKLSEKQLSLVRTFAAQAVIAIQNARLFNETKEALEQQKASAEILSVISNSVADTQPVFEKILESCKHLFGGDELDVLLVDEQGQINIAAYIGDSHDVVAATFPAPVERTPAGRAIRERRVMHWPDLVNGEDVPGVLRKMAKLIGYRSMVFAPMLWEDRGIGAIGVARSTGPFKPKELAMLQTFADQAVIAIQNARLFNETKEALERQTATADILKVIASSPSNVQPVFEAIAKSAKRLLGSYTAVVTRVVDGVVHLAAGTAENEAAAHAVQGLLPYPLSSDRIHARVARTGELGINTDVDASDLPQKVKDFAQTIGWNSMLVVPMRRNGIAIGTIGITRREAGSFNAETIDLLKTFADQALIAIENTRLFNETKEALERQTATSEILGVISSSPTDVTPVFDAILRSATRLCAAERGIVYRCDGEFFQGVAAQGLSKEARSEFLSRAVRPGPQSGLGRMLAAKRPVQIADVTDEDAYRQGDPLRVRTVKLLGARTAVWLPLLKGATVIGAFAIYRQEVKPFTGQQIALVQTFADQAVIAIENARLFNETQEALERQTATADILKVIASSPSDVQPVFEAIAHTANRLVGGFSTAVFRFVEGIVHLVAYTPTNPATDEFLNSRFPRPTAEYESVQLVRHGDPAQIADTENSPELRDIARARGYRSMLFTPLVSSGVVIGVVSVTRKETGSFAAHHVALLRTFADQAVIAIENVRLFDEVTAKTRDLSESLQQQTATADVLKVISRSAFDLKSVLTTLTESAKTLCGSASGIIYRREGDVYRYAASTMDVVQAYRDYEQQQTEIPAGRGTLIGRMALEKRVVQINDAWNDPEYTEKDAARLGNIRAMLGVPLMRGGEPVGAFALARREPTPYTPREVDLITTFADQAVIAIENARLLEEVRSRTKELSSSLEELRAAQDRLVQTEKLASLGQLTAGIAHEIKNPLNFVNNFSSLSAELIDELDETLAPAPLDHKMRIDVRELTSMLKSNLEKVVQHGKRADSIVKNMLLHSREGSGEHRSTDINSLVEESLNLAYHGARAEKPAFNIALKRNLDPNAGEVELYPQEITRALLNLIANGFYAATRRKSEANDETFEPLLSVATKKLDKAVEIRIRDNGTGMPPEVKEKMFNPFFTTKPAGEGTGLGLSMTHDIIVKQHGGRIDVETELGVFTEFVITLPRHSAAQVKAGENN